MKDIPIGGNTGLPPDDDDRKPERAKDDLPHDGSDDVVEGAYEDGGRSGSGPDHYSPYPGGHDSSSDHGGYTGDHDQKHGSDVG